MKNDFLTIPDAPNYEINSELIVRNKKTGRILSPYCDVRGHKRTIVNLFIDGTRTSRSIKLLRKQAVEADKLCSSFVPIFSAPLYEINRNGSVRNKRTKKILKPLKGRKAKSVNLYIDGVQTRCAISKLLFETFGIVKKGIRVPLFISKGNQRFYFDTLSAAARFLMPRLFLSFHAVYKYFTQRKADIYGWRINYQI